jgi:phosphatidate cytidylyltransferase
MSSNMLRRVLVAGIAIPAAVGIVYLGGWALVVALAVLSVAGVMELYRLADHAGIRALRQIGVPAAALVPLGVFVATMYGSEPNHTWLSFFGIGVVLSAMVVVLWRRSPDDKPLASVAITLFGVFYAAALLSLLILLRHPTAPVTAWGGTWLVFLPLVVVWACDTMAMAGGSLIGGPKLAPVVSPNKTWSGTVMGSVVATLLAPLYGWLVLGRVGIHVELWQLAVFGLVVSSLGQVGDLVESLFKREVEVKDSGSFFPGHGGVLDRLDSLYWAIPTAVVLLTGFGVI